ncbi:hypothetical protein [Phenylobacterium sp. 58.2.17]|jgi:hypothetical protein|nr:hypothetical protein [Phenylobacterium sp. 58.2.17]
MKLNLGSDVSTLVRTIGWAMLVRLVGNDAAAAGAGMYGVAW